MINLKDHRAELINLGVTIAALERIDQLIAYYSVDKPGPACCTFDHITGSDKVMQVQLDREIAVSALKAQRDSLAAYLRTLGIEA